MYRSTKTLAGYPCSHRQHRHGAGHGKCAALHGYSRSFHFTFVAVELDENHFVLDFGGKAVQDIKAFLTEMFDHTTLINHDDPLLPKFKQLEGYGAMRVRVLRNVSMEATAQYLHGVVSGILEQHEGKRVLLESVEVRENEKNSGIFSVSVLAMRQADGSWTLQAPQDTFLAEMD